MTWKTVFSSSGCSLKGAMAATTGSGEPDSMVRLKASTNSSGEMVPAGVWTGVRLPVAGLLMKATFLC